MAHFAEIDENNIVTQVVVVHDSEEHLWPVAPFTGAWIQCSYNWNIRKNYPGPGYTYDEQRDAFIAPQPYASWVLDETTCRWNAPVPYPDDGKRYLWDEDLIAWVENV